MGFGGTCRGCTWSATDEPHGLHQIVAAIMAMAAIIERDCLDVILRGS